MTSSRQGRGALGYGAAALMTPSTPDRKSTRLNSSHSQISYAVFCLKKKKNTATLREVTTNPANSIHSSVPNPLVVPPPVARDYRRGVHRSHCLVRDVMILLPSAIM